MNKFIDTVIFDLDGTLLDTLEDLYQSVIYTQQKLGYPLHDKMQVRAHLGNGLKVLMRKSIPEDSSEEAVEEAYQICQSYYAKHSNDATCPYEGVMEVLKTLSKEGKKLAIVSNKPDFAVKDLNALFFGDYIQVAIGEKESAGIRKKPAPDTVLEALEQLGSEVSRSVYIGDSEVDIKTAANCGMDLIACEWGFRDKDFLLEEGANTFAKVPADILKILQ